VGASLAVAIQNSQGGLLVPLWQQQLGTRTDAPLVLLWQQQFWEWLHPELECCTPLSDHHSHHSASSSIELLHFLTGHCPSISRIGKKTLGQRHLSNCFQRNIVAGNEQLEWVLCEDETSLELLMLKAPTGL